MGTFNLELNAGPGSSSAAPSQVGLGQVLELVGELLQYLQAFLVAVVYRVESMRELSVNRIRGQALMLAELRPVRQVRQLPVQIQQLLRDLQELSRILLQLLVNTTPLYNMVRVAHTHALRSKELWELSSAPCLAAAAAV